MRIYVGVDWSAREIVWSSATDSSDPHKSKSARRTFADVRDFVALVRARYPDGTELHVFIEAGAPGWLPMLHHAGAIVHVVDGKQAKKFAESWVSSGAKDDGRDAQVLSIMCRERCDYVNVWTPCEDGRFERLTHLQTLHEKKSKRLIADQQRLRACLRENFPALETVIGSLTSHWARRLMRAVPTPHHGTSVDRQTFDGLMAGTKSSTREKVWAAIRADSAPWLTADSAQAMGETIEFLLEDLEHSISQNQKLEASMDELTKDLDVRKVIESVGGLSTKMSNRLIAKVFGTGEASHRDQASIKLGTSPVFRGSGKDKKGRPKGATKMRRAAPSEARATGYLMGRLASQQLGWAKARFAWDMNHGKSAAQSYRSIARSLLRVINALIRDNKTYDDELYTQRLKSKGVPWAKNL